MKLKDLLPTAVIDFLHDRYVAAVADAVAEFKSHSADEDSITGALGQELSRRGMNMFLGDKVWSVEVTYQKIRGRGPGAPEKIFGSDGIFQIDVVDAVSGDSFQKALPFQSKVNWRGRNSKLLAQTILMQRQLGAGIVVDFNANDYSACPIDDVISAGGDRKTANKLGHVKSLGQMLGHDFINCKVGKAGLFFDPTNQRFAVDKNRASPKHLFTTKVEGAPMQDHPLFSKQ